MNKANTKSGAARVRRLLQERPETTVALNPMTGLHLDDLRDIAARTALQGVRQPLIFGKHVAGHARKLADILAATGDYSPEPGDMRFRDEAWRESAVYRRVMQAYLAMNESLQEWVGELDLDSVDHLRAEFLLRIIGDSLAPTNTLLGNPAALRKARETRGRSLLQGMKNLIGDIRDNHGIPSQVKGDPFELGVNIAVSPGAVVFRNDVLELIQYAPATDQVQRRPLLMVSAPINKFYALDLTPDRSMIKYGVDNGFQVFAVSWANPTLADADWGVDRYVAAVMEAIPVVKAITRSRDLNLFALCSGAMMMSAMAACLKARGDESIHSMTIGVCMLEMQRHDMEVSAFASPAIFEQVKKRSKKLGVLRGHELALSMLWLRPQELIWGNAVNNYLLGNEPPEFDLLFWNNDWTNLPAQLHCDVLDMFATGSLLTPGAMTVGGTALDLNVVDCDKFIFGGLTDHITPWEACYRSALAFGGNKEFVLSSSGHMQTMLNAPGKKRTSFFVNKDLPEQADDWLEDADLEQGSWWPHWRDWLQARSLSSKAAPKRLGNKAYPPGVAAPGSYVLQQSD